MIIDGFTLALITNIGFYLIYRKLPAAVRKWMHKHSLFTDFMACLLTYVLFGGTLVALFAAAWAGVMVSVMLALVNNPTTNGALESLTEKIKKSMSQFEVWLAEHFPAKKPEETTEATK